MQQLPPRGRAALLLRDVLGWSAVDSATLLDISVAALNSSLQRAREEDFRPLAIDVLRVAGGVVVAFEGRPVLYELRRRVA